MQEPSKFCPTCRAQHHISAAFCHSCGAQFSASPPKQQGSLIPLILIGCAVFGCGLITLIVNTSSNKSDSATVPVATSETKLNVTPTTSTSSAAGGAERMVLDNAQVTVYVECTDREYKRYKFHFIIKKPGSPLPAPILRQAGNPKAYAVVVNGVDMDDDFAFGPNIAAFDNNGDLIPATFVSRPLNSNVALGHAYHDLVGKYEKGK